MTAPLAGERNFAYDDENEQISVWQTNVWREDYVYDGKLRRRITRQFAWNGSGWQLTNEVHYVYDGNVVIQERDQNNLPVVTYTRGVDLSGSLQGAGGIGGLLARTDMSRLTANDPLASAYYHADGNGNITALVTDLMDTNQVLVAKYLYDPCGNLLAESGPLAGGNKYRFSSKEWDSPAGLYYYLYRFYDPNLQRWLSRDPRDEFGFGGLRRKLQEFEVDYYEFADNSPISFIDSFGLKSLKNFPQYGNYCGKSYCGGKVLKPGEQCDYSVPPKNAIDSCCKDHDKCYDEAEKCGDKWKISELKKKCDKMLCDCVNNVDESDLGSVGDGNAYNIVRNWACSQSGAK